MRQQYFVGASSSLRSWKTSNGLVGYSLLETLITLFIIAISMVMLVPWQQHFYQSSMAKNAGVQLLHAIYLARNEALLTARPIILCKSTDLKRCYGEWRKGFIIKDSHKTLYAFHPNIAEGVIYWRAFPRGEQKLEFLPSGDSKMENGTFWFCVKQKVRPLWAIVVSQAGRVRMVYPDQAGKIYDDNLQLIHCPI